MALGGTEGPATPPSWPRPLVGHAEESRGQTGVVTSGGGGAAEPALSQDGVAAAIGAGAVPGAWREGAAGAAASAVLLPLLQRAPLARVRLARGNGGPAAPHPRTGRDWAGWCSLCAERLGRSPATHSLSALLLVARAAGGWVQRCTGRADWPRVTDEAGLRIDSL